MSAFVQCIMQDISSRIRDSVFEKMHNLLLVLSVFNENTTLEDLKTHPSFVVVFNHVSRYPDIESAQKSIKFYKTKLTERLTEFYCPKISDDNEIFFDDTHHKWKDIKQTDYKKEPWYSAISEYERKLLDTLDKAQVKTGGPQLPLGLQYDPVKKQIIEDKINLLFPEENFHFFNKLGENLALEYEEIEKLIKRSTK